MPCWPTAWSDRRLRRNGIARCANTHRAFSCPSEDLAQLHPQPRPGLRLQLVFPEPQDAPPLAAQAARIPPVPRLVPPELAPPEGGVAPRTRPMSRAAMPEAAVDEHHEATAAEDEVRPDLESFARGGPAPDDLLPPPAGPTLRPQQLGQGLFGGEVTAPAHLGHEGAALGAGVDVPHVSSWIRNSPDRKVRAGRRLRQRRRAGIPAGPRSISRPWIRLSIRTGAGAWRAASRR